MMMVAAAQEMGRNRRIAARTLEELRALPKSAELNYQEAALYLGMALKTLYNLVTDGQGPQRSSEPGRGKYFIKADLDSWRASGRQVRKAFT